MKKSFGLQKEDKKGYKQMGEKQWISLSKLIDPTLNRRGWTEDLIRREETEC